jgi:hypothetical protein
MGWVRRHRVLVGIGLVLLFAVGIDRLFSAKPEFVDAAGHRHEGYTSQGVLARPSPGDVEQVKKQLDARAHAVLDGDRGAFLGVVDSDRPAFADEQRTVWSNTRKLPLAKLSYTYDGPLEPDEGLSTPSFLVRVTTTYEIKGYDTLPVQVDDGFTFVQQEGTWKLASVSDADRQFNRDSLPVPWDGAAIDTYGDGDFLVVVDRGRRATARRILALCHEGSNESQELLGVADSRPTVVLATSHATGYHKFVGLDFAAVTYPLDGPSGVTPGWRVFVNPEHVGLVSRSPVVLPHELAHLATQDYLAVSPKWLDEGSAEYVGWHAHGGLAAEMHAQSIGSPVDLPGRLPATRSFYKADVRLDYAEGTGLVTWLEEHEGLGAVLRLMKAYEDVGEFKVDFDPDTVTAQVLRTTFGITPTQLATSAYAEMNHVGSHS